jgi:ketol-acid reductoisomerase
MYSETDVDPTRLADRQVTILGYGSQGRAHAADGLIVKSPSDAVKGAAIIAFLTPDMTQKRLYQSVADDIADGAALLFAHGFAVHYEQVQPRHDLDVVLIAPKGPGGLVRRQYEEGHGVPCLVAIHQDATGNALPLALAYAAGIGGARAGVIQTTFAEETETDLFGEQAVLCGGATELIVAGFETLVDAGYQPEVAYYEVMHELKLIVDLLHEGGLRKMHKFISDTAAWGDMISGPRVVNEDSRAAMRTVLREIQDGTFARNWIAENERGMPEFKKRMTADLEHPIENVGADLRGRMDWLED